MADIIGRGFAASRLNWDFEVGASLATCVLLLSPFCAAMAESTNTNSGLMPSSPAPTALALYSLVEVLFTISDSINARRRVVLSAI